MSACPMSIHLFVYFFLTPKKRLNRLKNNLSGKHPIYKVIKLYNKTNYLTEFGMLYPPPPKRRQGGPAETTLVTQ